MLFLYSIAYSIAFVLMTPLFLLRSEKYAAGFRERIGNYRPFAQDARPVVWLHCVSVGEANAALPLAASLVSEFPSHRVIVSTTTKTGQSLARKLFEGKADAVFYFPYDWKFSVRRALKHFDPALVLLMETEIWPRFINEARARGAAVAIVNGRLSARSFSRYQVVKGFMRSVLAKVDLALMQTQADAERLISLGIASLKTKVTGNLKFDQTVEAGNIELTEYFRDRFGIGGERPIILAASTHDPEEKLIVDSLDGELGKRRRLIIAPRHPERFDAVADLISRTPYTFVRRSAAPGDSDAFADVIILDSIGELRAVYPLADVVFVGGSLIPHGGQNVLEPAAAGKPIVTGPHTENFEAIVREMLQKEAIVQIAIGPNAAMTSQRLCEAFTDLDDAEVRNTLGRNAASVIAENRGATDRTVNELREMLTKC